MFELAIQHFGFKGFDALSEQPVISLMQQAFEHQRVAEHVAARCMTDPAGAKGKDYFGDPKQLFVPERAKDQSLLDASLWLSVAFVAAEPFTIIQRHLVCGWPIYRTHKGVPMCL
eukprot:212745-Chlamydomonas_euryale.AAC.8